MKTTAMPDPKKGNHVKLTGTAKVKFREAVFRRDNYACIDCGTNWRLTLSHIEHAGMGGGKGPGDTMQNCCTRCIVCHSEEEHGMNGRVKR